MKKLFLSLTMAVAGLMAIANVPNNTSEKEARNYHNTKAIQNLQAMYGTVENLTWSPAKDNMLRADFQIEGQSFSTFFESDGQFVATTSEIKLDKLPVMARKTIQKKLKTETITNIVHFTTDTDDAYFAEVVDGGKQKIYRVTSNGYISRFK